MTTTSTTLNTVITKSENDLFVIHLNTLYVVTAATSSSVTSTVAGLGGVDTSKGGY